MNATRFPDLPYLPDTTTKDVTIFLKLISTEPHLNFLSYADSLKSRYFAQELQKQPVELLFQEYYDGLQTSTKTPFKRQLTFYVYEYAPSNTKLINQVQHLSGYTFSDIESVVNVINGNQTEVLTNKRNYTRFFAGFGINASKTGFYGDNCFSQSKKSDTYTPQISTGIDIFNNPNVQRFFLRVQLSASYINAQIKAPTTLSDQKVIYILM